MTSLVGVSRKLLQSLVRPLHAEKRHDHGTDGGGLIGFRVQGLGFRVQGSGFRVQGLGFRVWEGLGFGDGGGLFWGGFGLKRPGLGPRD